MASSGVDPDSAHVVESGVGAGRGCASGRGREVRTHTGVFPVALEGGLDMFPFIGSRPRRTTASSASALVYEPVVRHASSCKLSIPHPAPPAVARPSRRAGRRGFVSPVMHSSTVRSPYVVPGVVSRSKRAIDVVVTDARTYSDSPSGLIARETRSSRPELSPLAVALARRVCSSVWSNRSPVTQPSKVSSPSDGSRAKREIASSERQSRRRRRRPGWHATSTGVR